jgi:hypothetical protein
VIWFAPFQGLGEEEPFPRPPRCTPESTGDSDASEDAGEDQSRLSSASTRITAYAAIPVPSPV